MRPWTCQGYVQVVTVTLRLETTATVSCRWKDIYNIVNPPSLNICSLPHRTYSISSSALQCEMPDTGIEVIFYKSLDLSCILYDAVWQTLICDMETCEKNSFCNIKIYFPEILCDWFIALLETLNSDTRFSPIKDILDNNQNLLEIEMGLYSK